jgi:hypothetical protein
MVNLYAVRLGYVLDFISPHISLRPVPTDLNVVKKVKVTKKGAAQRPQKSGLPEPREPLTADSSTPTGVKIDKKYLRMALWVSLSVAFLGFGTLACGLLAQEESVGKAVLLFLGGLAGAAGCIFFFYRFLQEISPKPRDPFISTLH